MLIYFSLAFVFGETTTDIMISLCSNHYKQYKNFRLPCFICEKSTVGKRVHVTSEKFDAFQVYLTQELQVDRAIDITKALLCMACYNPFNRFLRSDEVDLSTAKTDKYLTNCLEQFDIIHNITVGNVDMYCFRTVLEVVVQSFLSYQALLLPKLYLKYKALLNKAAKDFRLSISSTLLLTLQHDVMQLVI